jgi:hypothetical protein
VISGTGSGVFRQFFAGQLQHVLLLACLLPGSVYLARPELDGTSWSGIADHVWFISALGVAIGHQFIGWFVLRSQLLFGLLSWIFGQRDLLVWGVIFFPFFVMRPFLTLAVGMSDAGSLDGPRWLQIGAGLLLLVPVAYTAWSVKKHLGIARALGGDHFREAFRRMPLVREGVFRFSSNAMYIYGFLLFWSIALLTGSRAGLIVALFQHAYIWVHMYCTEAPDMHVLYSDVGSLSDH